jgi:hypothetical protein
MSLIEVFSSSNDIEVEFIKDILDKNDILYMIKNEHIQNIMGGMKPFSGIDPLAGPIRIYVDEKDIEECKKIIEANSLAEENTVEKIETRAREHSEEVIVGTEKIRTIYVAYVLTSMSFLILPYFINLFILYKIYKTNKTAAKSLFVISSLLVGISLVFIIKSNI